MTLLIQETRFRYITGERRDNVSDILEDALIRQNCLCHHGILGQKWGVRRYQNSDGSLTDEGEKRYSQLRSDLDSSKDTIKALNTASNYVESSTKDARETNPYLKKMRQGTIARVRENLTFMLNDAKENNKYAAYPLDQVSFNSEMAKYSGYSDVNVQKTVANHLRKNRDEYAKLGINVDDALKNANKKIQEDKAKKSEAKKLLKTYSDKTIAELKNYMLIENDINDMGQYIEPDILISELKTKYADYL